VVTNRIPIRRQRRPLTTFGQMSLEHGDIEERSPFESKEDRQAAWERHKNFLLAKCRHGFRPTGWWQYDAPTLGVRRPRDLGYEKATLWEHGLLSPEEVVTLEREWRKHFDDANSPDYIGECIGYDRVRHCAVWVKGAAARRALYRWAGIPRALIKRWSSESGRPARSRRTVKPAPPKPATPPTSTPPATPPVTPPLIG
jgi:hypothetical protein